MAKKKIKKLGLNVKTKKQRFIHGGGNIKLGNMGTISKLMGNKEYYTDETGYITGTCGCHCEGCEKDCYVKKSYRYPSVILSHARTTKAFRDDIQAAFYNMDDQLTKKKTKFKFVRINQSGEIETEIEFRLYIWLANRHPETTFYIYTKAFEEIRNAVAEIPTNFFVNISVWNTYGVNEYLEFSKVSNQVSAFVYCDEKTGLTPSYYESLGLHIEAFCGAYDKNGKLNHDITCDKCPLCHSNTVKVVGCWSH